MTERDSGEEKEIRSDSRLEKDDPEHCKKCGAEIPSDGYHDSHGRPMSWSGTDWVSLELCPDCWARGKIRKIRWECTERYAGEVPEVLDVE
jgi:hypothetical protein